ncbi:Fc receptor 4 [Solea senegalensis]|uniref:Fc receptor 4 n=1 Tax=Solea senegalensis TaxID=28829 RepID=A0AAV6QXE7_SOLSE|nr:Fc receptor-like protein 5 isoform X1 [Solea senegalensis]KAG7496860.1 Fc receptor 4 [Solea senegalensis]
MKTALLFLLSLSRLTSTHSRALVRVAPDRTQFFEYENITVTCEHLDSEEWTVWRYAWSSLQLSACGSVWGTQTSSTCFINTVKPSSSGVYWCESNYRESSSAINITVTDRPLILKSPILPVMQGRDVTLHCQTKDTRTARPVTFFKDDHTIWKRSTGHMTIHNVSKSDEGAYRCKFNDENESLTSWLLIKADDLDDSLSLTMFPESTQLSEYENLLLTCGNDNDDNSSSGFHIKRFRLDTRTVSSCGVHWGIVTSSVCKVSTLKPADSGIYWCESLALQRSSSVNLTIYAGLEKTVLLQSPIHPPAEGDNVTLRCKTSATPFNQSADFYKDGYHIQTTLTGHMTLYHISKSDEGVYMCTVNGVKSPTTWLLVKGDSVSSGAAQSMFTMIRCVVVSLPYLISTLFMVFRYRDIRQTPYPRHAEKSLSVSMTTAPIAEYDERLDRDYGPSVSNVTTEHRF